VAQQPRPVRWIEEAEDPELEARLVQELGARSRARREERERRRRDRRSRVAFLFLCALLVALVALIGYGAYAIAHAVFGA
jgi:cell division septal protein FtsQ